MLDVIIKFILGKVKECGTPLGTTCLVLVSLAHKSKKEKTEQCYFIR